MIGESIVHGNNNIESAEKRSFTGAVVNLKKLLKTMKRIFATSKPENQTLDELNPGPISAPTEEELQNWLNEQLEAKNMLLG